MKKALILVCTVSLSLLMFIGIITAAPATLAEDLVSPIQEIGLTISQADNVAVASPDVQSTANSNTVNSNSNPISAATAASTPSPINPVNSAKSTTRGIAVSTQTVGATPKTNPTTTIAPTGKATNIINTAKQYIGVKYVLGGTTPQGFDCSGFVQYVFAQNGLSLPRTSSEQSTKGETVSLTTLLPGDLIFFSSAQNGVVGHVGIYLGSGQFINASSSKGVTIYSLSSYWTSRFIVAKRVI